MIMSKEHKSRGQKFQDKYVKAQAKLANIAGYIEDLYADAKESAGDLQPRFYIDGTSVDAKEAELLIKIIKNNIENVINGDV